MRHSSRWLIGMTAGLVLLLSPAWAPASVLESPADGATVSGLGFISGWKCDAGNITVKFFDVGDDGELSPLGEPISLATQQSRADTRPACGIDDNGFIAQINWNFLGDGSHIAVVYDDEVEFGRATFSVVTAGQEFVRGASGECRIDDFPAMGETATFEWNESTQHLELAEIMGAPEDPEDMDPGVARFDGTWTASLDTMGAGCAPLTEFPCEISDGDVICLGGVVEGTVDSSGAVDGTISFLESEGELSGTLQGGSGSGTVSYTGCSGDWTLTKQ